MIKIRLFHYFEPSKLVDGAKTGDPREKKHLTTQKQNILFMNLMTFSMSLKLIAFGTLLPL